MMQLQGTLGVTYPRNASPQALALAKQLVGRVTLLEAQGAPDAELLACYGQLRLLGVEFQVLQTTTLTVKGQPAIVPAMKAGIEKI